MKFAVLLVLAVLMIQESPFTESEVYGEWIWLFSKGGLMDHTLTPETVKNSKRIVMTKDHVVMIFSGDSLTLRKNYQIQSEKTVFSESFQPVLHLAGMNKTQTITLIGKDTLVLKDNAFDGYTHNYVRLK
jgi:hypothetical protein